MFALLLLYHVCITPPLQLRIKPSTLWQPRYNTSRIPSSSLCDDHGRCIQLGASVRVRVRVMFPVDLLVPVGNTVPGRIEYINSREVEGCYALGRTIHTVDPCFLTFQNSAATVHTLQPQRHNSSSYSLRFTLPHFRRPRCFCDHITAVLTRRCSRSRSHLFSRTILVLVLVQY